MKGNRYHFFLRKKESLKKKIVEKQSEATVFTKNFLKRNRYFFFYIYLPKKLGREKSSKKNLKRQYLRRNLWREITTMLFFEKKSTKETWKRKTFQKKSEETVFTKKSLKRNHYQFSFKKKWKKKIFEKQSEEKVFTKKSLKRKIFQKKSDSIHEEIFEEKSLPIFLWKKMKEKKSSKNNLKRKYLRRNLWREKSSKKNLKRQYFRRNLWREITTNFPLKKRKLEGKNRRKTIWRESIYEVIFEEKSLSKDFWKIIYQRNLEEKNLPKKTDETVFTIFF